MAIDDQKTLEAQMRQLQQDRVKRFMGVGAPGNPTSVASPSFSGEGTIAQPKSRFPALATKTFAGVERPLFDKVTQPLDLSFGLGAKMGFDTPVSIGINMTTDIIPKIIDPAAISPAIRIEQTMNFDNPQLQQNFEKALGVRNKDGKELYFRKEQGYKERLEIANRYGATKIIKEDGALFDVPWDNLIYEQTRLPNPDRTLRYELLTDEVELGPTGRPQRQRVTEEIRAGDVTREEFERIRELKMLGSLNFSNPEVGKPMFADLLNQKLIQRGMTDARTRADLINTAITTPTMDDHRKVAATIGENTVRFTMGFGLWGIGETADITSRLISANNEKFNADAGWGDIRQSDRRAAIMEGLWLPLSHTLVAEAAQRGVIISLADAETYISTLTGLAPRIAKLTGEFVLPSRMAASLAKKLATNEHANFKQFFLQRTGQQYYDKDTRSYKIEKVTDADMRSFDDIMEEYLSMRSGQIQAGTGTVRTPADAAARKAAKETGTDVFEEPTFLQKVKRNTIETRIRRGMQTVDSQMLPANRQEVIQARQYVNNLTNRRNALMSNIEKRRTAGGVIDDAAQARIRKLDRQIDDAIRAERRAVLFSAQPKFMRDMLVTDAYMVIGAGTAGHFFQQRTETGGITGDPLMGELFGLAGGIALSLVRGNVPAALDFVRRRGYLVGTNKGYTTWLAQNISSLEPELQQQITMRADAIDRVHTELIAEGLDPELLDIGFADVSGLITLKSVEDLTRARLSMGQVRDFNVSHLQEILDEQIKLVRGLRRVVAGIGVGPEGTPKGDFQRILSIAIDEGQSSIDTLTRDLDILNKRGVEHYLDITRGNTMSHQGKQTKDTFAQAMDSLEKQQLINADDLPRMQLNQQIDDATARITDEVAIRADYTRSQLASTAQARVAVIGATTSKVQAAGQKSQANVASMDTAGDLLATIAEARHSAEKAKAKAPYAILDNGQYVDVDADGNILGAIEGKPVANVGTIFDQIFVGVDDLPTANLRKANLTSGEIQNFDITIQKLSEPYFAALAQGSDQSVDEVVDAMVTAAQESGMNLITKGTRLSKQTQLVQWLRKTARDAESELDAGLDMSFSELRELDKSVRHLRNKAILAGNTERAAIFENIETAIQQKFDDFSIIRPDGERVSVNELHVVRRNDVGEDEPVKVGDLLNEANSGWAEFKRNWYDTNERATMPKWMSWGDRSVEEITVNHPLGIRYARNPSTWFQVDVVGKMDPETTGKEWYDSLQRTIGQRIINMDGSVEYAFLEGDKTTIAFEKVIKTALADHIISTKGTKSPADLAKLATNINEIFVMKGADGRTKPLLDIESVITDAIGFSRKTVGDEAFEAAEKTAISEIQTAISKATEPAEKMKTQKQLAVKFLEKFSGERLPEDQIANALVSGGVQQLQKLRREFKNLTDLSDEEIDATLANVYVDSMERSIFYDTGFTRQSATGASTKISVINVDKISEMLGLNDPEKARMIEELIGTRRYKVWQAVGDLMTSRENHYKRSDFDLTGVPRSFSMESYISRLYAINRGVISLRYAVAEATLMAFRQRNFIITSEILKDPKMGELFIEMVRSGKAFKPLRNGKDQFTSALVVAFAKMSNEIGNPKPQTGKDQYGREFTVYPDINSSNIPRTGRDISFDLETLKEIAKKRGFDDVQKFINTQGITRMKDGRFYGVPIPTFPEIERAQQQNFRPPVQ